MKMAIDYYESLRDDYENIKCRLHETENRLKEYITHRNKFEEIKNENKNLKEYIKMIETNFSNKEKKYLLQIADIKKRLSYNENKHNNYGSVEKNRVKINNLKEDLLIENVINYNIEN
jgi:predicted nuclease with TOPRIM domain